MPVLNGSAAGRVITRYKTYTSYNVLHLVIRIFVTVNFFRETCCQSTILRFTGQVMSRPSFQLAKDATNLIGTSRSDLRRAHGLCHTEEHDDSLAAAAGRERFVRLTVAAVDVLPVVHHPHVPSRSDR